MIKVKSIDISCVCDSCGMLSKNSYLIRISPGRFETAHFKLCHKCERELVDAYRRYGKVIDDICKDCDRIPVSDFKEYKRYSDDEYIDMCRRVDQLYAIIDELTGDADAVIHGWRPKMVEDNTNKSYIELK